MKATLRHTIYTVLALLCSVQTYAYDFEVDGICYNLVSASELTCEVASKKGKYEGNIVIPERVTVNGKTLNVIRIGESAFSWCDNLYSIFTPNSIQEIGKFAFSGCENLSDVTLSEGLKIIGGSAFNGCSKLRVVRFPSTLEVISGYAFYNTALQSVDFPENVREIQDCAFSECEGLTRVVIPPSVEIMKSNAFTECPNIVDFIIQDSPSSLGGDDVSSVGTYAKNVYFGRNYYLFTSSTISIEYGQFYTGKIKVHTGMFDTSSKLKKMIISGSVGGIEGNFGEFEAPGKLECLIIKDSNNKLTMKPSDALKYLHVDTMYIGRNIIDYYYPNKNADYPDVSNLTMAGSIEDVPDELPYRYKLRHIRLGENIKSCNNLNCESLESIVVEAKTPPTSNGFVTSN